MMICLRITGGNGSHILSTFMIFKNQRRKYPILGFNDDVPGVMYCSSPRVWFEQRRMADYLI